jgi:hypothetical protein
MDQDFRVPSLEAQLGLNDLCRMETQFSSYYHHW